MGRAFFWNVLFLAAAAAPAQDLSLEELLPDLKDRAVVLDIVARVVERNQEEVWNAANSKVTIPGRPVGIRLVGANVVVAIQLTPYRRRDGRNMLVAQGQIWVDIPNEGIRYQATMETIPLEYGEPVYFFPLGSTGSFDRTHIEIQLTLYPYGQGSGQAGEPTLTVPPPPPTGPSASNIRTPDALR
ncbi:MAG: hypothetical protein LBG76_09420 [Treponema sp.]|nr:hypothetical protein [Treponema sp.]